MSDLQTFSFKVNDGPEQTIQTPSSIYMYVAAAIPAMFEIDLPAVVEIWYPKLLPKYGPYFYKIKLDECGDLVIRHAFPVSEGQTRP